MSLVTFTARSVLSTRTHSTSTVGIVMSKARTQTTMSLAPIERVLGLAGHAEGEAKKSVIDGPFLITLQCKVSWQKIKPARFQGGAERFQAHRRSAARDGGIRRWQHRSWLRR